MFPEIDTSALKERMDSEANFMLVDARTEEESAQGNLQGTLNIPPNKLEHISDFLPEGKDVHMVFYSRGFG